MRNKIIINQPAGLGDIFYTQKIASIFSQKHDVLWPILDHFMFLKDYLVSEATFIPLSDYKLNTDDIIIDLQNANFKLPELPIMLSKYFICNIDANDWLNYFNFNRNIEKENQLFQDLNLAEGQEYTLISQNYGSFPNHISKSIDVQHSVGPIIYLIDKPPYTLFDWCKVIEHASILHMVDTSFNYIIEKLTLKAQNMYLYSRHIPSNFFHINYIFKKPWTYI